ncbi:MAG TPA: flagellar biosynthetic protein FliO [Solirubrobacteraceae bacterium]|nr:flagellar biosynthetic protein FliO [Solirubrobacteraceae bacterium]
MAFAATTTTPTGEDTPLSLQPAPAAEQTGSGGGIVRTIVGLAVVLGVIYGLHWVLKQVKASRENASTGRGLQPLSTLALGPGRSLHLVRAGGEIVLVGSAEQGVTPLRTWSVDEARALGLLDDDGGEDGDDDRRAGTPLNAGTGSPPNLRRLMQRAQSWTVRR